MKEAMHELADGRATVLSSVSKPYRITLVTQIWKVVFPFLCPFAYLFDVAGD
jgi:hypothetical protein